MTNVITKTNVKMKTFELLAVKERMYVKAPRFYIAEVLMGTKP